MRPEPITCPDEFTPHSKLRRRAGIILTAAGGEVCSMTTSGGWKNAKLELVWIDPSTGHRYKTRLSYNPDNDSISELRAPFYKVTIPTTADELQRHPDWEDFCYSYCGVSRSGIGLSYDFCSYCHGLGSEAREVFRAFADVILREAFESGWCEDEEGERQYQQAHSRLVNEIEAFDFDSNGLIQIN